MRLSTIDNDGQLSAASEQGRICALAGAGQRDLQHCAADHPDLFPRRPFDPALFSTVSLATAFGAPWCDAEQLRVANRTALWIFAADWLIDCQATTPDEVARIVASCQEVADGAAPPDGNSLARFLATIRDEVAAAPAFPAHRALWRDELRRMLSAMAREWEWKTARAGGDSTGSDPTASDPTGSDSTGSASSGSPTFADYLANADNFGSTFVNVSHWIRLGEPTSLDHLPELLIASREVQRVLRLVNDLATYGRDVGWGDLNAIMITGDRETVRREIADRVRRCQELLRPLADRAGRDVVYLHRQIGFSTGFYQLNDFWGAR